MIDQFVIYLAGTPIYTLRQQTEVEVIRNKQVVRDVYLVLRERSEILMRLRQSAHRLRVP